MAGYDSIPSGANLDFQKFQVSVPEEDLTEAKDLLRLSKLGPRTFENLQDDTDHGGKYGVTLEWITNARDYWLNKYDWRATEKHVNSFPQFTTQVKDEDGEDYTIHFMALFSKKEDAVPVVFLHGWPGNFLEFLGVFTLLKDRYTPEDLPYHVICPSLPGYAFSSGPTLKQDFDVMDASKLIHKVLMGLGFGSGYIAQGGDVGSGVATYLAATYDECKAYHVNMLGIGKPEGVDESQYTEAEIKGLQSMQNFHATGMGYAIEHATRPSTIGFVLSSNPLALLAWIGEKYLTWVDKPLSLDQILDAVALYWYTQTFPRSIYPYRMLIPHRPEVAEKYATRKPMGYSFFPKDLSPAPKSWAEKSANLVWFKAHDKGGHFAALEQPELLLEDTEDFVKQVWKKDLSIRSKDN